ncbi:MAG: 4-alpha-glucanotransferase [Acidobacteria bacterium]|nr:4-alpha-glucanotransferase [Acidobacteriota bacterium]
MKFSRASGILLHPTSLPGRFGIGELGAEAYRFVDFLVGAAQRLWQVLPLGPTGYGDSPYQCFSAFAGNPLLISLEKLAEAGWLSPADLEGAPSFPNHEVDYGWVIEFKLPLLRQAFENFKLRASRTDRDEFEAFCQQHASWLDHYALFMAVKDAHGGVEWTKWEPSIAQRQPEAIVRWSEKLGDEVQSGKFSQHQFFKQWAGLKEYCHERGVKIMGDIPIFVAHDSADVWAHPESFYLDADGRPTVAAGVPPDYFSATGQLWGNPPYRWDVIARSGYAWWIERFRATFSLVDVIRLDHFRGFEAYWEVPTQETTAINGRWVKGPGAALVEAAQRKLGELPIVAENLGVITPEVEAIRNQFGFPGMAILQFAFGNDPQAPSFKPHNYPRNLVAYTGTHDNDTTIGWWTSAGAGDSTRTLEEIQQEREFALKYLGTDGREMNWVFIRTLLASVADIVIIPFQDVLGLGSEARMNTPAKPSGNWRWRYRAGMLANEIQGRLKELTFIYDR